MKKPPAKKRSKKTVAAAKWWDKLGERRRKNGILVRLDDEEVRLVDELVAKEQSNRSAVLRRAVRHLHENIVLGPFTARAETEIMGAAVKLARDQRLKELRDGLLDASRKGGAEGGDSE